jgi:ketosteroid isomerase-like protein
MLKMIPATYLFIHTLGHCRDRLYFLFCYATSGISFFIIKTTQFQMKNGLKLIAAVLIFLSCNQQTEVKEPAQVSAADGAQPTAAAVPASEILDMSTTAPLKNAFDALSRADIEGFTAELDDNVRMTWSSGDSLVGKQAVKNYWTGRWTIIDSLSFTEHIFVPMRTSIQQSVYAPTGKWILHWAMTNVKYKNGKKLTFWTHVVNHYNDAGKIDFVGYYMDRAPIMAATKGLAVK